MTAQQIAACRSCNARILWQRTSNNKGIPLDADPSTIGDYVIVPHVEGGTLAVFVSPKSAEIYADIKERYRSHLSTCPDAQRWKRRD